MNDFLKNFLRVAPVTVGLIAVGLMFKSCDNGGSEGTKRTSTTNETTGTSKPADDGDTDDEDPTGPDQTDGAVDTTVYTLDVSLEDYADTDVDSFRFYIDAKDGSKQTFLKEVAASGVDFTAAVFKFASSESAAIKNFVDAETCLTLKAVRGGLESEESVPYCFSDWN